MIQVVETTNTQSATLVDVNKDKTTPKQMWNAMPLVGEKVTSITSISMGDERNTSSLSQPAETVLQVEIEQNVI